MDGQTNMVESHSSLLALARRDQKDILPTLSQFASTSAVSYSGTEQSTVCGEKTVGKRFESANQ